MAKKSRAVRMESNPDEEKIVEQVTDFVREPPARLTNLFDGSRREIVSAIPVAPPVGYVEQPTLVERIRAMVRSEHLRYAATEAGYETFEDAEDYDVGDDYEPHTPYEAVFDPPPNAEQAPPAPNVGGGGGPPPPVGGEATVAPPTASPPKSTE